MIEDIVEELKIELQDEPDFNENVLRLKVKNAVREVRIKRAYDRTSYTEEQIEADLERYYAVILNVARYDYNKLGVEGQSNHSENGINRTYVNRDSLMVTVHPFVGVL